MKTIKHLIHSSLIITAGLYMNVAVAQPPLSKLPQATPPLISEATKQTIKNQFTARSAASVAPAAAEAATLSSARVRTAVLDTNDAENLANQKAQIDNIKTHFKMR